MQVTIAERRDVNNQLFIEAGTYEVVRTISTGKHIIAVAPNTITLVDPSEVLETIG